MINLHIPLSLLSEGLHRKLLIGQILTFGPLLLAGPQLLQGADIHRRGPCRLGNRNKTVFWLTQASWVLGSDLAVNVKIVFADQLSSCNLSQHTRSIGVV